MAKRGAVLSRDDRTDRRLLVAILLSGSALLARWPAQAQTPPPPRTAEPGVLLDQATTKGLSIGPFNLNSGLTLGETYDDNIFATPSNRVGDLITTISPFVDLRSDWTRNMLNFRAGGDFGRYANHSSENYNDYWVGSDGRFDVTKGLNFFGGASFAHLHESRESPDNSNGTLPTTYDDLQSHLGVETTFGRFFARFGGTFEKLNYNDVPASAGFINNDDRDRNVYGVGGRTGMNLGDDYQVFLQATHNWREYRLQPDDFGFDRNSSGNEVAIGVAKAGPGPFTGEVYVGYLNQNYVDPSLGNVSVPDFGGELTYRLSPVTRLTAFVSRSVRESDLAGIGSYLDTTGGMRLDHDLQRDLHLHLRASYTTDDFTGSTRRDEVASFAAGVRYFFLPQTFIGFEYQYQRRDSNVATASYDDNQFMLRLGAQLARGYAENAVEPTQDQGFYIGTQMDISQLSSNVVGPRGSGGSLDANFGSAGVGGTLFGGYGAVINNWYVGAELDGEESSAGWNHVHTPGRVFSVDKGGSIGINGHLGYVLDDGSVLYGLVGAVWTELNTSYQTTSGRQFPKTPMQMGYRVGGGIESPITRQLFLRMQYAHTVYNDYDVTIPSGTDSFGTVDDTVSVGLIYRFFDQFVGHEDRFSVPATRFDGFYAGAQVGYGGVNSWNKGPREGGTTLTADRGGDGPGGGFFGGYGKTFNRLYVGAEIAGGGNGESWVNKRDPAGREYGVNKVATLGASARIGYVLGAGTLIYGRIGPNLAFVETQNDVGASAVTQNSAELGLGIGFGLEAPVNDHVFVRADYCYNVYYPKYDVTSGDGSE